MITQALLTLGLSNTGFPLFSQCSAIVVNRSVYVSWPNLKNTHSWTCQIKLWTWSSPFAFCFILPSGRYEQIIWALYALRLRLYSTRVWTRSKESDNDIQWHDTDGQTSSKPREEIYDHNPIKISLRRRYAESDATLQNCFLALIASRRWMQRRRNKTIEWKDYSETLFCSGWAFVWYWVGC